MISKQCYLTNRRLFLSFFLSFSPSSSFSSIFTYFFLSCLFLPLSLLFTRAFSLSSFGVSSGCYVYHFSEVKVKFIFLIILSLFYFNIINLIQIISTVIVIITLTVIVINITKRRRYYVWKSVFFPHNFL